MMFPSLPQEKQDALNAVGIYMAQYSSAIGSVGRILNAVRLSSVEAEQKMQDYKDYYSTTAQWWFEFSTQHMPDEEATRFADEAIASMS